MKIVLVLLAALCLPFTGIKAPPLVEETQHELEVGETVTIAVDETPSTGYLWSYEISDDAIVEIASEYFRSDNPFNTMPGGDGGTRYITVRALNPGKATVEMVEKRGEDEIGDTRSYHILVTSSQAPVASQSAALPMTAQQWIRSFLSAADEQDLTLEEDFAYEPGMYTGQHSYSITIEETPAYFLSLSVFSEDGVDISACSMRMVSGITLSSDELARASDLLWRTVETMIAASDPETSQGENGILCESLYLDLPTLLMSMGQVDTSQVRNGIRYSLWAGPVAEEDPLVYDGFIVDFVVESEAASTGG